MLVIVRDGGGLLALEALHAQSYFPAQEDLDLYTQVERPNESDAHELYWWAMN